MIDLTKVMLGVIDLCVALATAFLVPWLKANYNEKQREKLAATIDIAVYAAQQLYEHAQGAEKLEYVKEYLRARGYDADTDEICTQIEAAVKIMKAAIGE